MTLISGRREYYGTLHGDHSSGSLSTLFTLYIYINRDADYMLSIDSVTCRINTGSIVPTGSAKNEYILGASPTQH